LPTEFRIFRRGLNTTENGDVIFDETASDSVMAAYKQWAVDVAIDLDHAMITEGPSVSVRDAMGWCQIEVRDGELWATNVRWTPAGAERLASRSQRYVSPAFLVDEETRRVTKLINIAITALPASHGASVLVAASLTTGRKPAAPSRPMTATEAFIAARMTLLQSSPCEGGVRFGREGASFAQTFEPMSPEQAIARAAALAGKGGGQ
jgi:phage I-like protein